MATLPLTEALLARWRQAVAAGHGHDDVASAITAMTVRNQEVSR
jgi:hypothetical protein